jgi:hypothetical protein
MVSLFTPVCDCSKCIMWRNEKVHGNRIIRNMNQWQVNPRFYACEYIADEVHNEESYLRLNKKDLLPGVRFSSPSSSVSAVGVALIKLSVKNIRERTYTATSMARVMDLHHGFNLCGLDAFRFVEPTYLGHER